MSEHTGRDFADLDSDAEIKAIFTEANPATVTLTEEGPRPLYRDLPSSQPFPIDALGFALSRAAKAIEALIQCRSNARPIPLWQ
jgi:hypothetical protein